MFPEEREEEREGSLRKSRVRMQAWWEAEEATQSCGAETAETPRNQFD